MKSKLQLENEIKMLKNELKSLNNELVNYKKEFSRILREEGHISPYGKRITYMFNSYIIMVLLCVPYMKSSDFPIILKKVNDIIGLNLSPAGFTLLVPLIADIVFSIPALICDHMKEEKYTRWKMRQMNRMYGKMDQNRKLFNRIKDKIKQLEYEKTALCYDDGINSLIVNNNILEQKQVRVLKKDK